MTETQSALSGVLHGIRVLDFGRYIAGPYCAALLADLGADVVRIERREGGEDRWVAPVAADGAGALYLAMNRNKRGMTLDPAHPQGREIVQKLVATADVVVANLPPEVLRLLSLDLESLRRVKPDIILTTVTAFGAGGPWSDRHGFDGIGQLMSGAAYLTGTPEQPMRAAVAWVDFGTASVSAFGTLAALIARRETRRGQKVEAALLRTAVAFTNSALLEQQVIQVNRVATLNRGQTSAPSDVFRTKDGWIIAYAIRQPVACGGKPWLNSKPAASRRSSADLSSTSGLRATGVSRAWENSRPIAAPTCATSLAGPRRSSRAISEACRLAGTAIDGEGIAATARSASWPPASNTALVISSTNNGMPSVRSMMSWRTLGERSLPATRSIIARISRSPSRLSVRAVT